MSDSDYKDLYDMWQRKAMHAGFSIQEFRCHYAKYVSADNKCALQCAIGAKLAYKSLLTEKKSAEDEMVYLKHQMESISWL